MTTTFICLYITGVCLAMIHALRISARKQYYLKYPNGNILFGSFIFELTFPILYPLGFLISLYVYFRLYTTSIK